MEQEHLDLSVDIKSDYHVHTRYCRHAVGEMEEYVQAAVGAGLEKIVFLEHMEEGISWKKRTWLSERDFDSYFSQGRKLQHTWQNEIEIGLGVECGFNNTCIDKLKRRLNRRTFNAIGISCHFLFIPGNKEYLNLFSRDAKDLELATRIGPEKLFTEYFNNLLEAVRVLDGTFLCHLDGALRHLPENYLDDSHYRQIDHILQLIAEKEMALEVNCSGLRIRGEQFPANKILNMARSYNIRLQLGSDAHRPQDVGAGFARIAEQVL